MSDALNLNRVGRMPKKVIWGTVIVCCVALAGFTLHAVFSFLTLETATKEPQAVKPVAAEVAVPVKPERAGLPRIEAGQIRTETASVQAAEPASDQRGGNMSEVMALRADIDLLKLQVEKKELLDKLRPPPPAPMPAAAPAVSPGLLDLPPVAGGGVAGGTVARKVPLSSVVAVQGVNDSLSAVIRTGGKLVTVRKGQSFDGGVITNISRNSVAVRNGDKTSILPFE
jgi:type IV pilus biogenesis protein PilP